MSARIIDNADLYDQGRGYTRRITRFVVAGEDSGTALRRVAADRDWSVAEVRSAVRFAAAVDLIAGNAGRAARRLILAGHRRLPPERVLQISRTHPERQRHAMDQVARGRHPFAMPRDRSDPPYDTIDHGEVSSRMARSAGLLDWVAHGLAGTPDVDWPEAAKVQRMSGHVAAVRESCTALGAMLRGWSSDLGSPPRKRPGSRPGQSSGARAPFQPDRALSFVAAVGGMAAKNVRDFPRLLRDVPPQAQDLGSVLAGLRRLDLAARELTGVIRAHGRSGAVRRTRWRPARRFCDELRVRVHGPGVRVARWMFSAGRTYGGAIAGTAWIGTPVADRIAATGRALTFTRRGRVFRGAMRRGDATVAGTRVA